MIILATKETFDFHIDTNAPDNGEEYVISYSCPDNLTMILDIEPSNTVSALTVKFESAGLNGNYVPMACYNVSDVSVVSETTSTENQLYQVVLTGICKFRAKVDAIADGIVNIKGKIVG